jgi:hypothetical protein
MRFPIAALLVALLQGTPAGDGAIAGRVLQHADNEPLEDAQVVLAPLDAFASSSSKLTTVLTDASGRFEFKNLTAGRYRILWGRSGYVLPPAATSSNEGIILDLPAAKRIDTLTLSLHPAGVISGRAVDSRGRPPWNIFINPLRVTFENGRRVLVAGGNGAFANDRGEFRIYGLPQGEYYLRIDYRSLANYDISRIYFPGTNDVQAAASIRVRAGEEANVGDFKVEHQPGVKISGRAVYANLDASNSNLRQLLLIPPSPNSIRDSFVSFNNSASYESRESGAFEVVGVSSARYEILAIAGETPEDYVVGTGIVDVGSRDVDNTQILLKPRGEVRGRIRLSDGKILSDTLSLQLSPLSTVPFFLFRGGEAHLTQAIDNTGAFLFPSLPDLRYRASVKGLPRDACVTDIRQGGESVYDDGFRPGGEPIEIVASVRCGTMETRLKNARQQSVGAIVVLAPSIEHRSNAALYRRATFDAGKSSYLPISGIPPGDYKLFAWESIPSGAELNADFLAKDEVRGVPVTVEPGTSVAVEVAVIPNED